MTVWDGCGGVCVAGCRKAAGNFLSSGRLAAAEFLESQMFGGDFLTAFDRPTDKLVIGVVCASRINILAQC